MHYLKIHINGKKLREKNEQNQNQKIDINNDIKYATVNL